MDFPSQTPMPFDVPTIERAAPIGPGCYGIFRTGDCIYVGQAQNIKEALLEHATNKSEWSICIWHYSPNRYFILETSDGLDAKVTALTSSLHPMCPDDQFKLLNQDQESSS